MTAFELRDELIAICKGSLGRYNILVSTERNSTDFYTIEEIATPMLYSDNPGETTHIVLLRSYKK